ncbi:Hypothetical predicted protein [Pelobates cultripes]|uniref:Uncharacterized protein n=1 Tax=Pelobates cultripes TaxID=61616 RepID=A0AAD1R6I2_PELCU|nr:Hypothetical predicted protein [Pelobates cultripes]
MKLGLSRKSRELDDRDISLYLTPSYFELYYFVFKLKVELFQENTKLSAIQELFVRMGYGGQDNDFDTANRPINEDIVLPILAFLIQLWYAEFINAFPETKMNVPSTTVQHISEAIPALSDEETSIVPEDGILPVLYLSLKPKWVHARSLCYLSLMSYLSLLPLKPCLFHSPSLLF